MAKVAAVLAIAALAAFAVFSAMHYRNSPRLQTANVSTNVEVNPTAVYDAFIHYKNKHNFKWGKSESDMRLGVFTENYKIIAAHQAKNASYELGFTSLAHLTREEFAALKLGYIGHKKVESKHLEVMQAEGDEDDDSVDWVAKGAVTPVKNQGQCGSCWAFSTTGALEGLNQIKNGKLVSLSEQELVDCSDDYGNQGCNGGLMDNGFQYAAKHGVASEADYPYTATDGDCKNIKKKAFKNEGHQDVKPNNDEELAAAIKKQPVSVAIEADTSDFQLYKSGVITGDACGTQLDHGVLAVGYGVEKGVKYIKVKNSWGGSWGKDGYVLIGRAPGAGICGINSDASYPTL